MIDRRHVPLLATAAIVAALLIPATAGAARPGADLKVSKVSKVSTTARQGALLSIKTDTVVNVGTRGAAKTVVRYYLTRSASKSLRERKRSRQQPRGSWTDVRLDGARAVSALGPRANSTTRRKRPTKVRVPLDAAPGSYTLLACADDRDSVDERSETNNCTAATGKVRVTAVAADAQLFAVSDYLDAAGSFTEESILAGLTAAKPYCTPGKQPRSMSKAAAIASLRRAIQKQVGAAPVRQLTKQAGTTALSAQRLAGAAALKEAPGAALLAMIRAHELDRKEASHLVGAAGIATTLGYYREALALLDAAAPLDDLRPGGFGISNEVAALHTRGAALLGAGRYKDALPLFEAALERQPLLSESASGAVRAANCSGKPARAVRRYRHAKKRSPEEQPPAGPLAKESDGVASSLPRPLLPNKLEHAEQYYNEYRALEAAVAARLTASIKRRGEILTYRNSRTVSPITRALEDAVINSMYSELLSDAFRAQKAEATASINPAHDLRVIKWCVDQAEGARGCDGHGGTVEQTGCMSPINEWNNLHNGLLEASWSAKQAVFERQSKIVYAHAALIADPQIRELVMMTADPDLHMAGIYQAGNYWTREAKSFKATCNQAEQTTQVIKEPGTDNDPNACNKDTERFGLVADLKIVKFKVTCSAFSVEASTNVAMMNMLGAFAEASYDFAKGELTVVAGSKGGMSWKGSGAEFKSGVYITAGANGVSDVGMRVGPSATVSAPGNIAEFAPSSNMDFTFLPKPM